METHHVYQCHIKENARRCHQDPVQSHQRGIAHCYPNEHAKEGGQGRDKVVEESSIPLHPGREENCIVTYRRQDQSTSAVQSDPVLVQVLSSKDMDKMFFITSWPFVVYLDPLHIITTSATPRYPQRVRNQPDRYRPLF